MSMVVSAKRFVAVALTIGVAVFGPAVYAEATMLEFQLCDGSGGYFGSPSYGLQVNGSSYRYGSYGNNDFFSFEDGNGKSTMCMSIDTGTGCVTVSGQMRHGSTSWYGTKYSGETWDYEACLKIAGDWNPRDLEECLINDPSSFDELCFEMDSSSFQLSGGNRKRHGYNGPTSWSNNSQGSRGDYRMGRNHNGGGHENRYACQGWFSPFGQDGPKMFHEFGCDYTPPQCNPETVVPEPATMPLLGLGLAVLATRHFRKKRNQ